MMCYLVFSKEREKEREKERVRERENEREKKLNVCVKKNILDLGNFAPIFYILFVKRKMPCFLNISITIVDFSLLLPVDYRSVSSLHYFWYQLFPSFFIFFSFTHDTKYKAKRFSAKTFAIANITQKNKAKMLRAINFTIAKLEGR